MRACVVVPLLSSSEPFALPPSLLPSPLEPLPAQAISARQRLTTTLRLECIGSPLLAKVCISLRVPFSPSRETSTQSTLPHMLDWQRLKSANRHKPVGLEPSSLPNP